MNRKALIAFVMAFVVALVLLTVIDDAKTATPKPTVLRLAPPVVCTMANRMDAFIDEDNIMWECTCEVLKTGHICRWQVIGGVDPVALRKLKQKHRVWKIKAYTVPPILVRLR